MPRALDAVELPRCAELSVDASGRAVRADPARAKVTTRGIEAMPIRGMIPESAETQRSTGLVGPKQVRNHLGATRRLLNFFSPRFGAGKPVCGKTSFRELFTRRERLLYEGISIGRRDHSSW